MGKFAEQRWFKDKELKKKQEELDKLASQIKLYAGQPLTSIQNQEIENWKVKMEAQLNDLVLESKKKEVEIKLEVYREIIKIIGQYQ